MYQAMTLGIPELPLAASVLTAGCLYGVVCEERELGYGVVLSIAQQSIARVLTVAAANEALTFPEVLLPRIAAKEVVFLSPRRLPTLQRLLSGYLVALGEYVRQYRSEAEPFVVVLEGVEQWVLSAFPEAVGLVFDACRHWAVTENIALVLVFSAPRWKAEQQAWLRDTAWHYFSGLAWVQSTRIGCYRWCTQFWHGSEGLVLAKFYSLERTLEGALSCIASAATDNEAADVAQDHHHVMATRQSLIEDMAFAPAHWLLFDSLEQLAAAANRAVAATLLVHAEGHASLTALLQWIHAMRTRGGNALKIIVRNIGAPLRYNNEQVLLSAGATVIIPAELAFTSLINILHALQFAVYPSNNRAELATLLEVNSQQQSSGYLAPQPFCEAVLQAVKQANVVGLQCVLVRLMPVTAASVIDLLRLCSITRRGDICTADNTDVLIFLFACANHVLTKVLERIFGMPLAQLFHQQVVYPDRVTIASEIKRWSKQSDFDQFADASTALHTGKASLPLKEAVVPPVHGKKSPVAVSLVVQR